MWFVLGAKGSSWAWQNNRWDSIENFKRTQRKWAMWGVLAPVFALLLFGSLFMVITTTMKNSAAYMLAVDQLQHDPEVIQILGTRSPQVFQRAAFRSRP
jgi:H+/Cl- antiporter ClcA